MIHTDSYTTLCEQDVMFSDKNVYFNDNIWDWSGQIQ